MNVNITKEDEVIVTKFIPKDIDDEEELDFVRFVRMFSLNLI